MSKRKCHRCGAEGEPSDLFPRPAAVGDLPAVDGEKTLSYEVIVQGSVGGATANICADCQEKVLKAAAGSIERGEPNGLKCVKCGADLTGRQSKYCSARCAPYK